jgi:hypothetical protein
MRFSKRIKICKGLSINLSKSGASLSAGRRGASVNIGTKGTFINAGIPGTGISTRKKIRGNTERSSDATHETGSKKKIVVNLTINLDEAGKPIIKDKNGNIISDERNLKQIKRQDGYKEVVKKLVISRKEEIEKANRAFLEIYRLTPPLHEIRSIESKLNDIKLQKYVKENYAEEEPSLEKVKTDLESKENKLVNKILFWKRDTKKEIDPNKIYQEKLNKWKQDKIAFEEKESSKKEYEDAKYKELYENARRELELEISNSEEIIANSINEFLTDLVLPIEFSIDFEYFKDSKSLYIDLDLPEIEDLPKNKATISASEKFSIKPKTNKELKEDYARCTIGLAFFFAGNFFNISQNIENITISGYTQRLSKKTGNIEDEYIYSIRFTRNSLRKLRIESIDPVEAINNFEKIIKITSTYEMKTIEPLPIIRLQI